MDKKLKVLMVSDSFFPINGGREQVIHQLMSEYSTLAIPTLFVPKLGLKKPAVLDESLPYRVIRCKSLKLTKNEHLSILDRKSKQIINNLCKEGIDIIHTETKYALCSYAIKLGKKYNIPVVTTAHTNYIAQYKSQLKLPIIYKLFLNHVRKNINKCDGVTTPSIYMKHQLTKLGIKKEITVIANGDDLTKYSSYIEDENNLNDGPHNLLYVGRLTSAKNLAMLLEALKLVKDANINFSVKFVGGGEIKKFKMMAKNLEIECLCDFMGPITSRKELASIYARSDLNLIPSIGESFGLTMREAASLGTPSLVIEGSAPAENITHNLNGFIAKNDPIDFAQKIISVLNNKNKLHEIGNNARLLSNSWNKIANDYLNYYKTIIQNKDSRL